MIVAGARGSRIPNQVPGPTTRETFEKPVRCQFTSFTAHRAIPFTVFCPDVCRSQAPHRARNADAENLRKKVSRFAISKGLLENSQGDPSDPFANIDESKLEQLMSEMAPSMQDDGGQEDPKQMAHLMKRMFELTGGEPTGAMLEAIKRMEAGEDPDSIDEELGPAIDEQPDPFSSAGSAPSSKSTASKRLAVRRLLQAPKVDPELYELEQ